MVTTRERRCERNSDQESTHRCLVVLIEEQGPLGPVLVADAHLVPHPLEALDRDHVLAVVLAAETEKLPTEHKLEDVATGALFVLPALGVATSRAVRPVGVDLSRLRNSSID